MQLIFSFDFAQACAAEKAAFDDFDALARSERANEAESTAASQRWDSACDAMLMMPARTAAELGAKLSLIEVREIGGWRDWPTYREALDRDLIELRRPAATLHQAFKTWRAAFVTYVDTVDRGEPGDQAEQQRTELGKLCTDAFRSLMAAPCASPGDFMAKVYVDALETLGRAEPGGWDVDIAEADDETIFHDEWQRSAYRDLDHSDLGACLLAFGRLDFSAADWIERALALNIPLAAHAQGTTVLSLQVGHFHRDTCDADERERRQRERRRLERLLAFHPSRSVAVAETIVRDWPQLVDQHADAA